MQTRHAPQPLRFDLTDDSWSGGDERGNCIVLFDPLPPHRRRDRKEAVQGSLRRAVWLSREPIADARVPCPAGADAYAAWIGSLLEEGPAVGAAETAARLAKAYRLHLAPGKERSEMIGIRHILHRSLTSLAEARGWACAYLGGRDPSSRPERRERTSGGKRPPSGRRLPSGPRSSKGTPAASSWPPVIEGDAGGFLLALIPDGFEPRLRREETARCLGIAADAYRRAIVEIERTVPPVEQEIDAPDEDPSG